VTGGAVVRGIVRGAAAGAAGTTALNAMTYLDMAVRGRPSSSTPQETVRTLAAEVDVSIPGEGETEDNRVSGLGPLLGIAAGVGTGAAVGVGRQLGFPRGLPTSALATLVVAMLAGNAPMTATGVTDPRSWSVDAWLADVVPHVAFAGVAAAVLEALQD
jgi:hypothetical protein